MKKLKITLMLLIAIPLVTSCHLMRPMTNGAIPLPKLDHGWSPVRQMELNGKKEAVQCMTVSDKQKLTTFLLTYEAQLGAK